MRRIDHARPHGYAAHLKAMLLTKAHRLIRVLRNARANQRVILLRAAARNAVVNKGISAVAQAAGRYEARLELFVSKRCGHSITHNLIAVCAAYMPAPCPKCLKLALHSTLREPRDDLPLEDDHQDDQRNRDAHRACHTLHEEGFALCADCVRNGGGHGHFVGVDER